MFTSLPENPHFNLLGAQDLLLFANTGPIAIDGKCAPTHCEFQDIKEAYGLLRRQLKDRVNLEIA